MKLYIKCIKSRYFPVKIIRNWIQYDKKCIEYKIKLKIQSAID